MAFFGKSKKEDSAAKKSSDKETVSTNPNESIVYRDGVFEAFENTENGKKYGRILKYHGDTKIFEMNDADFELWRDASVNFNKYRITYERDEEFFIEKATIELAVTENRGVDGKKKEAPEKNEAPAEQKTQPAELSEEDKEIGKQLLDFYNKAVQAPDCGEEMLKSAGLNECFATSAFCDRKLIELVNKARSGAKPGEQIKIQMPQQLAKLSEFSKKELFKRVMGLEKIYVIYSQYTKRQHSAAGNALVALSKQIADAAAAEIAGKNQKVYIKEVENIKISAEFGDINANGLIGIRFLHKYGLATVIQLNPKEILERIPFPENIAVRRTMNAFFQDLKNGIPAEKLKNAELAMYDAIFKGTFIQPCVQNVLPNGEKTLTVSIIKDNNGSCLLDLFSSVSLMERSESYTRFIKDHPETSGYKKWTFEDLIHEIESESAPANGFVVDKECIPVPFNGKSLEKMLKLKKIWDDNGKSFVKKAEN